MPYEPRPRVIDNAPNILRIRRRRTRIRNTTTNERRRAHPHQCTRSLSRRSRSYPSCTRVSLKRFYSVPAFPTRLPLAITPALHNWLWARDVSRPIRNFPRTFRFSDHPRQLKSRDTFLRASSPRCPILLAKKSVCTIDTRCAIIFSQF